MRGAQSDLRGPLFLIALAVLGLLLHGLAETTKRLRPQPYLEQKMAAAIQVYALFFGILAVVISYLLMSALFENIGVLSDPSGLRLDEASRPIDLGSVLDRTLRAICRFVEKIDPAYRAAVMEVGR